MSILRRAKEHMFVLLVAAVYLGMFLIRPDMGLASVKNSAYYIKEMLMIMPVIFVLTALLDTWVPKQQIMRFLGRESGVRGAVFSLALGSISAGPIYAAFPLCVMLHKKGASIRNVVIILSTWAVIKVPMLLNELKFLGFQFMAVRWALTVTAILVFSWITAKIVDDKDLPDKEPARQSGGEPVVVSRDSCIGCGICAGRYPQSFGMEGGKAYAKQTSQTPDRERLLAVIRACPTGAIAAAPDMPPGAGGA